MAFANVDAVGTIFSSRKKRRGNTRRESRQDAYPGRQAENSLAVGKERNDACCFRPTTPLESQSNSFWGSIPRGCRPPVRPHCRPPTAAAYLSCYVLDGHGFLNTNGLVCLLGGGLRSVSTSYTPSRFEALRGGAHAVNDFGKQFCAAPRSADSGFAGFQRWKMFQRSRPRRTDRRQRCTGRFTPGQKGPSAQAHQAFWALELF